MGALVSVDMADSFFRDVFPLEACRSALSIFPGGVRMQSQILAPRCVVRFEPICIVFSSFEGGACMRTIPDQLLDIAGWLAKKKIKLAKGNENRRIDSVKSHSVILDMLAQHKTFGIKPCPKPTTGWYSFEVNDPKGKPLPVKIKVSSFSRADNLNCKLGIYHALTGVQPEFSDEITWSRYFDLLKKNLDPQCADDFYFLVVNRTSPDEVFCNSLKGLQVIRPNGSNLPFQCNWSENRNPSQRSNKNATEYILDNLGKSALLRAGMLHAYKDHF